MLLPITPVSAAQRSFLGREQGTAGRESGMIYLTEGDVRLPGLSGQGPPYISKEGKLLKIQNAALGAVGLTQMIKVSPA